MPKLKNELMAETDGVLAQLEGGKNQPVAWCVARNRAKFEKPMADLRKMLESTPAMKKLNEAIQKAAEEFAEKGPDGKPKTNIQNDRVVMPLADIAGYTAAVEALRVSEDHAQALTDEKDLKEKEETLLQEETDFEPFKLKIDRVKDGDMNGAQMKVLFKAGILED
jgi:hypothetical protein